MDSTALRRFAVPFVATVVGFALGLAVALLLGGDSSADERDDALPAPQVPEWTEPAAGERAFVQVYVPECPGCSVTVDSPSTDLAAGDATQRLDRRGRAYFDLERAATRGMSFVVKADWLPRRGQTVALSYDDLVPGSRLDSLGPERWSALTSAQVCWAGAPTERIFVKLDLERIGGGARIFPRDSLATIGADADVADGRVLSRPDCG